MNQPAGPGPADLATTERDPATSAADPIQAAGHGQAVGHSHGHGRHGWMMIACCVPMLVIAVILVATGVVSPSFLIGAVACTLMMALMMRGMGHGGGHDRT